MSKKVLALSLILVLAVTLGVGCRRSPWNDGEYRGEGQGYKGPISVNVTIARGKINAIVVTEQTDTADIADRAVNEVPNRIIQKQSTEVDVVAGATATSRGIIEAVNSALEKARKQ